MAITQLQQGRGLGELLGTGLGSGLSSGLQQLAAMKINEYKLRQQRNQTYEALTQANIPENIVKAVSNVPTGMQREVFRSLLNFSRNNNKKQVDNQQSDSDSVYDIRKQLFSNTKGNVKKENIIKERLLSHGVSPEEVDILFGKKLNDKAILYFLSKTNNNPKKAKQLAKKFGYEV